MDWHGTVASLNVGRIRTRQGMPLRGSAIDKRPVEGRVPATAFGFAGDAQADRRFHGGPHQAIYAYALEDLRWWAGELAAVVRSGPYPGQFGENLTTIGVDVTNGVIGERWQVGSAVLEVSAPRIPCRTFAAWMGVPGWVKRFAEHGACGAYLRVITEGDCGRGDDITLLSRPAHGVTIGTVFAALLGEATELEHVAATPQLAPAIARDLGKRLLREPVPAG
ncbi:MAG: domain containing protein [Frankiales bacterium]|nr:domain containing protein [Frankiales bacterium]